MLRNPNHSPARQKQGARESLRVLVVEDDPTQAKAMLRLLEHEGLSVRAAGTYKQALKTASEWVPDVLVSDLDLPGKDGIDVMGCLRKCYPRLRGIMVSGHTGDDHQQRWKKAGFAEYLHKPLTGKKLIEAINKLALTRV